jgi:hypothetical protein
MLSQDQIKPLGNNGKSLVKDKYDIKAVAKIRRLYQKCLIKKKYWIYQRIAILQFKNKIGRLI